MKNAKKGLLSIKALISMFSPKILSKTTTGMNNTIAQTQETAKHPHCIMNTVFINAQHRRNRGGICGNTYGNGFDIFSCCSRQFEKSSVSLFIIPSSEFFVCLPISHTTPTHTVSHRLPPVQGLWTLSIAHLPSENNHRFLRANASPAGVDI